MCEACSMYGGKEKCVQGFGGEHEGKISFWRPRTKWEGIVKTEVKDIG